VVVPLASLSSPGQPLEGTRLTLVRVPGQPDAAEFSIRTPVTPPRCARRGPGAPGALEGRGLWAATACVGCCAVAGHAVRSHGRVCALTV
jgi:hypothetical protein